MSAPTPSEAVRVAVQECKRLIDDWMCRYGREFTQPGEIGARDEIFATLDRLAALSLHVGDASDTDTGASASPTALCAPALRASAPIAGAGGQSDRWIPVTRRLPERDSGEVLVWLTGERCAFAEWHTHREDPTGMGGPTMEMGLIWRDYDFEEITHWMPLPPPPDAQAIVTREGQDPQGLGGEAIERGPAGMRPEESRAQPSPHIEPVHLIFYDDTERRPEIFGGSGATAAAHHRFKLISGQWNAHLFVKIKSNTRDDQFANANAVLASPTTPTEGLLTDEEIEELWSAWVCGPSDAISTFARAVESKVRAGTLTGAAQTSRAVRDAVDYALEHAEYMATSAERLLESLNGEDMLRLQREESDDVDDDTLYDATCTRGEFVRGLRSRIYEFRKRAERCATDRYPQGGDRNGLRGEAIEPGPKDAPESDASKSASTLTDPEGAS